MMIETNQTSYQYQVLLPFEESYSHSAAKKWMEENWHTSFYYSIAYVMIIFSIKYLMTNSKPYSLSKLLLIWNTALAIFSITAFIRTVPEFVFSLNQGTYYAVCSSDFLTENKVSSLWTFLFVLSKLPEFGDTIFIVLRKQPLIFLHWYHHILTLIYSWYSFKEFTSSARAFVVMNTFIHSMMYSYYAFKAMKIRIPRFISVIITFLQICQMAVGCYVNYKVFEYIFSKDLPCGTSQTNVIVSSVMYFSYFYLFARFFYLSYLGKKQKSKRT
ncbi:very long chain fatty acid elongase 6-like [Planococcus citri]|uniref:very long chain fatty acid elongase 6-like n=1 Tax=Planococcus citri TaxID=170843 RepID=UPI0031F9631E